MITGQTRSRPHTQEDGSTDGHTHDHTMSRLVAADTRDNHDPSTVTSVGSSPDVMANIELASRLVRLLTDQERAERLAYEKGWADCGNALAYATTDAWKAGYHAGYAEGSTP